MLNICEICWILNNKHTDHTDTESWPISRNCCVRFSQFRNTLCFQHWVINILKWPLWFYAVRTFAPADCSRAGPAVWMDLLQRHALQLPVMLLSSLGHSVISYLISLMCLWDFVWIKVGCWTQLSVRPCLWICLCSEMFNQLFQRQISRASADIIQ